MQARLDDKVLLVSGGLVGCPHYKVWERKLGGRPVPFCALEVPAPLPVPGATVMIEAWAYAP